MDIPVFTMVMRSGWIARLILLLLVGFSIITWGIIFNRFFYLGKISRMNKRVRLIFQKISRITDLERLDEKVSDCPLGQLSKLTAKECRRIVNEAGEHTGVKDWSFYLQNQFAMASERLHSASAGIASRLDHGVFLLAIVSSVAPFMGLLGTVWGIMNSFYEIGNQGSASLPVVAPGIAEALITTIVGLAVAIPSVFFYNIFIHRAQRIEDDMEEFSEQLALSLKSEIFTLLYGERNDNN